MGMNFNAEGERPTFMYKKDPEHQGRWEIHAIKPGKRDYEVVGEYLVVDEDEDLDLAEKKVANINKLLNGKGNLLDLTNLTNTRLLFNIEPKVVETDPTVITFRTYDGDSISKENAVLTLEKGVLNDIDNSLPG